MLNVGVGMLVRVGVADGGDVAEGVAVGSDVTVGVAVGCSVPVGVSVGGRGCGGVAEIVADAVAVGVAVGVSVLVGEGVAEAVGLGFDGGGAPARIQAVMRLMSAADSGGAACGMRVPSPAPGPVSFVIRKLSSGKFGLTRSRPLLRATILSGGTFTSCPYDTPVSSTRLPARAALLWQPLPRQFTLKMVL